MKFTLGSSELLKKLQFLSGVINNNNGLPILDNFLFEFKDNMLEITASDLESRLSTTMVATVDKKLSIAIPAKLLVEILKTFSEQPLEFTVQDNSTIEIKTITGVYEIAYHDGADYPKPATLDQTTSATISSKVLVSAIGKTLFATGTDDLRPVMTGVLFQLSPEGLTFVSTDSHRLVKYARTDVQATQVADFIMPKKPLNVLKGMLGAEMDVTIEYNTHNAMFMFSDYVLVCRLIDGKYPNYEAVIPKDNPNKLTIDRSLLLTSVKRLGTFSNKSTHQIKFLIKGQELNISAEDIDYSNKADERLACNYAGEDIAIGFNARFLAEALSNMQSEQVEIEMSQPNRAGVLTPADGEEEGERNLILVMPVMLSN